MSKDSIQLLIWCFLIFVSSCVVFTLVPSWLQKFVYPIPVFFSLYLSCILVGLPSKTIRKRLARYGLANISSLSSWVIIVIISSILTIQTLSWTITMEVAQPPIRFSYGVLSDEIGLFLRKGNTTFSVNNFSLPVNYSYEVNNAVNVTNYSGRPFGMNLYLVKTEGNISGVRLFEINLLSNDGREFPIFKVVNGSITYNESVYLILNKHITWSINMRGQRHTTLNENASLYLQSIYWDLTQSVTTYLMPDLIKITVRPTT